MPRGWKIAIAVLSVLLVWVVSGAIVRNGFFTTMHVCQHFRNPSLQNQTIIVTGANSGIGLRTAQVLSKQGANVIFACRSEKRGSAAARGYGTFMRLDLSDPSSIQSFYAKFERDRHRHPPLTMIVCNAGIFPLGGEREFVQWGEHQIEKTFAVNHLGHFHLVRMFTPILTANRARVVVVSSGSYVSPVVLEDMRSERDIMQHIVIPDNKKVPFSALSTYGSSKRCNVLFARELFERYGIPSCSIGPGALITTGIARGNSLLHFLHHHVVGNFTMNADQGAATTVYACLLPPELLVGQYISKPFHPNHKDTNKGVHPRVNGDAALWSVSERLVRGAAQ